VPFDSKQFLSTENSNKKWKIGVIKALKDIRPSLATERAMESVVELLKKEGH
jgi:hypothetical protein